MLTENVIWFQIQSPQKHICDLTCIETGFLAYDFSNKTHILCTEVFCVSDVASFCLIFTKVAHDISVTIKIT